jgi:hypothetical protein
MDYCSVLLKPHFIGLVSSTATFLALAAVEPLRVMDPRSGWQVRSVRGSMSPAARLVWHAGQASGAKELLCRCGSWTRGPPVFLSHFFQDVQI